ncbi:MAG: hypothetical protein EHM42_06950, partial [Planctomycetaceae bacterium]
MQPRTMALNSRSPVANSSSASRREFLRQASLAALASSSLPYWATTAPAFAFATASERPVVGCIGTGDRWRGGIGPQVLNFG